ncbi:hypothetical protein VTN96DRAFT_6066 [Rasamsonia emersonii]
MQVLLTSSIEFYFVHLQVQPPFELEDPQSILAYHVRAETSLKLTSVCAFLNPVFHSTDRHLQPSRPGTHSESAIK